MRIRWDKFASALGLSLLLFLGQTAPLLANPSGGVVVAGAAMIGPAGATLTINQSTQNAIINWQQFSIAGGQATKFIVPTSGATLNRVTGGNPSAIYGSLSSNGTLYLVNPNGIVVGPSGRIDTAGFLASTLDVSNQQFLKGGALEFTGSSAAAINNAGVIHASSGDVYLLASQVSNTGTLAAAQGTVGLAAGNDILFQPAGDQHLFVQATAAGTKRAVGVTNSGTIRAAAAELKAAGGNAYALAINNSGVIAATGYRKVNGQVYLTSDGGSMTNRGRISARTATGNGGRIVVEGTALKSATSGQVINAGTLDASATVAKGKGGAITVRNMGGATIDSGGILSLGGLGGAGGSVEISGRTVGFTGTVDLRAQGGTTGTLLLDPTTLDVTTGGTGTIVNDGNDATSTTIDPIAIENALANASIVLNADTNITITNAITWTSTSSLTLNTNTSGSTITINAPISGVNGALDIETAASGDLITTSNAGAIAVAEFILGNGSWHQVVGQNNLTALPSFTAGNDFELRSATNGSFTTTSTFLRSAGVDSANGFLELTDVYGLQGIASPSGSLLGTNFELVNDVDASGTFSWNAGAGFVPIGTAPIAASYTGTFNGRGHTIDGLFINASDESQFVGLFGIIESGAVIENVGVINANIAGGGSIGAVVGEVDLSDASVENCFSTGTITAEPDQIFAGAGGLVGFSYGRITDCYSSALVSAPAAPAALGGAVFDLGGLLGGVGDGTVANCYSTGSVSAGDGIDDVGGLVGINFGAINNSYSTSLVTAGSANYHIGGLVGENDGTVDTSYATGAVTGGFNGVGGLVGYNQGAINNSYSTSLVTAGSASVFIGGLVGENDFGTIDTSYAAGAVTGGFKYVGGLVGLNEGGISNSYSTSLVTAGSASFFIGGLAGDNFGTIDTSYAAGAVTGGTGVGGLIGINETGASATNSFWDVTTTGFDASSGFGTQNGTSTDNYGLSTANLLQLSTYLGTGTNTFTGATIPLTEAWDFGANGNDLSHTWVIFNGQTRPLLGMEYSTSITNGHQLQLIGLNTTTMAASYQLASDIDLSGTANPSEIWGSSSTNGSGGGFVPIGSSATNFDDTSPTQFVGQFEGQGHTINQLYINAPDGSNIGVFGQIGAAAVIENVGVTNAQVTGGTNVAPLVGSSFGTITNSYATGTVTGGNDNGFNVGGIAGYNDGAISYTSSSVQVTGAENVGGLVGGDDNSGVIKNSFATGAVTGGSTYVGGLVGVDEAAVIDCYSTASVSGGTCVGGLIGGDFGSITNCYSTGAVSAFQSNAGGLVGFVSSATTIATSFWDSDTAGVTLGVGSDSTNTTPGVTAATTAQLRMQSFFPGSYDFTHTWTTLGDTVTAQLLGAPKGPPAVMVDTINGTAFIDSGTNRDIAGITIELISGGAILLTTTTSGTGAFSFSEPSTVFSHGVLLSDTGTTGGNTYYQADAPSTLIPGVDIFGNTIRVVADTASNAALAAAAGSLSGGVNYSVTNGNLFSANNAFNPVSGYVLDGDVTAPSITISSPVTSSLTGPVMLSSGSNISVNADITNTAGGSISLRADNGGSGNGTVIFNNGAVISTSGGVSIFFNPSVNPAGSAINTTSYVNPIENFTPDVAGGATLTSYLLVNTLNDLQNVQNNLSGSYALGDSIDASATSGWNGGAGFVPIGSLATAFTGGFSGLGQTISNLSITLATTNDVGLFGVVSASGTIGNLLLQNVAIRGQDMTGAMVGDNQGTIISTGSSGSVRGHYYVGGLVGHNSGSVANSFSSVNVTGGNRVGGLVGQNGHNISNSYSAGSVTAGADSFYVGGLVGASTGGTISNTFSTGNVTAGAGSSFTGGLVGQNSAAISNSYSAGAVSGTTDVGGLVGDNVAGLGTISSSFWDTETTGVALGIGNDPTNTTAGVTGATTAQLSSHAFFAQNAPSFHFANVWTTYGDTNTAQLIGLPETALPVSDLVEGLYMLSPGVFSADATIDLLYSGNMIGSTTTDSAGGFTFNVPPGFLINGILLTNPNDTGNTYYQANAPTSGASVNITSGFLTIQADTATNAALGRVAGTLSAATHGINFSVAGANLTTSAVGVDILSAYNFDGNLTAGGSFASGGTLTSSQNVTVTANSISLISGSLTSSGSVTLTSTGPVRILGEDITLSDGDLTVSGSGLTNTEPGGFEVITAGTGSDEIFTSSSDGLEIVDSTINALGGNISLTGHAGYSNDGNGNLASGMGIRVGDGADETLVETSGGGNITLVGASNQAIVSLGGLTAVALFNNSNISVASGAISITGTVSAGTANGPGVLGASVNGVDVLEGATVQATGTGGSIALTGSTTGGILQAPSGANEQNDNEGVFVSGSLSVASSGTLSIIGTGGIINASDSTSTTTTGNLPVAEGVGFDGGMTLTTGANSTVTIMGTSGAVITSGPFTAASLGVDIGAATLTFSTGNTVDITGHAGAVNAGDGTTADEASSARSDGVHIGNSAAPAHITIADGGSLGITGFGGGLDLSAAFGTAANNPKTRGISISGGTSVAASGSTTITLTGTGGTIISGDDVFGDAIGVNVSSDTSGIDTVVSSGSGQIQINGTGGTTTHAGAGVAVGGFNGGSAKIETTSGGITLSGTGGGGYTGVGTTIGGSNTVPNFGVALVDAVTLSTGGTGAIGVTGTGGANCLGVDVEELANDSELDNAAVLPVVAAGGAFSANALSGTGIDLNGTFTAASVALGTGITGNFASVTSGPLVVLNSTLTTDGGNITVFGHGGISDPDGIEIENSILNAVRISPGPPSGVISLTGEAGVIVNEQSAFPDLDGLTIAGEGALIEKSTLEVIGINGDSIAVYGDASVVSGVTVQNSLIGLEVASSTLTTAFGTIALTGTVNSGTALATALASSAGFGGDGVEGLRIGTDPSSPPSIITATAVGFVSLVGDTSGSTSDGTDVTSGAHDNTGVAISGNGTTINSDGPDAIFIRGTSGALINNQLGGAVGNGNYSASDGVYMTGGITLQSSTGSIVIIGVGGSNSAFNNEVLAGGGSSGVVIDADSTHGSSDNGNALISSLFGPVNITGTGGTSANSGVGIAIVGKDGANVTVSTGQNTLTLNGVGGAGNVLETEVANDGVVIGGNVLLQIVQSTQFLGITIIGAGGGINGIAISISPFGGVTGPTLSCPGGILTLTSTATGTNGNMVYDASGPTQSAAPSRVALTTPGNVGIDTPLVSDGEVNPPPNGGIQIQASNITLNAPLSAIDQNILLVDTDQFVNNAGANALTTSAGNTWQIWSVNAPNSGQDIVDNDGNLAPDFIQYGATFSATTPAATGDGLLYSYTPAPIALAISGNLTKIYDDTLTLPISAGSYSFATDQLLSGDTLHTNGSVPLNGTLNSKDVSTAHSVIVDPSQISLNVSQGGIPVYGYTVASVSGAASVTPATLTATLNGPVSKVYDGKANVMVTPADISLSGILGGDSVLASGTGAFDSPHVGTGRTIMLTSLVLSGADAGNYQFNVYGVAALGIDSITPAPLLYVANPVTFKLGSTFPDSFSGTVAGFVNGENQASATTGSLTFSSLATDASGAASYAINGSGLTAANYTFAQAPGNATALSITADQQTPSTQTGGAAMGGSNIVNPGLAGESSASVAAAQGANPTGDSSTAPVSATGTGIAGLTGQTSGDLAGSTGSSSEVGKSDSVELSGGAVGNVPPNAHVSGALGVALGPVTYKNLSDALKNTGDWTDIPPGRADGNETASIGKGHDGETILHGGEVAEVEGGGVENIALGQAPAQLQDAMNNDLLKGMDEGN